MLRLTSFLRLPRAVPRGHLIFAQTPLGARRNSTRAAPVDAEEPERPNIYKVYTRPFAKIFLGAWFTSQVLYWAWETMRTDEIREERIAAIASLEQEIEAYKQAKKS